MAEERKIEMRICESCKRQFYSFTNTKCLNCRPQHVVDKAMADTMENLVVDMLNKTANNSWAADERVEDSTDMVDNIICLLTDLTGLLYKKGILTKEDIEQKLLSGGR